MIRARTWLFVIAGLFASSGFVAGLLSAGIGENHSYAGAAVLMPIYVLTYLWMKADAREHAVQCPPGATPLIVGLYPLAVPYHLIATRPGWRKAVALLWLAGFSALVVALNSLATYCGYCLAT